MFGSKIKQSEVNSGDWNHQVVRIEINETKIKQKMNMVGINEETLKILKEQKSLFEQHADEIVGKFYEKISTIPHLMNIINNHSTIERLKMTQKEYFLSLASGVLDEQYIMNRKRVGRVHDKIKLEPEWFFGAYQLYYKSVFPLLTKKYENDPRLPEVLLSFTRLTNFDMQLVEETYLEAYTSKMLQFDDIKKLEGKLLESSEIMVANAEETSSSVQNMYASSQEITAATEEAAVYAEQVQKMGYRSKDAIESTITHIKEIETLMEKLQDSMVHIADSSTKIGEIISLIQGIAKQTNILSLNASIEAARAGEHGKGFSVVANEVKGLAQRTHEALEDISNLIQQSQGAVSIMMEAVNKTNLSVHEGSKFTVTLQKELNQMMEGITNNLEQVTTVTKQIKGFAEMSEQISNSSQEIAEMAEKLHSFGEELSDKLK